MPNGLTSKYIFIFIQRSDLCSSEAEISTTMTESLLQSDFLNRAKKFDIDPIRLWEFPEKLREIKIELENLK